MILPLLKTLQTLSLVKAIKDSKVVKDIKRKVTGEKPKEEKPKCP